MGGLAMKHVGVTRKSAKEYYELVKEVTPLISTFAKRFAVIPAYEEKVDFGDMDVLVLPKTEIADMRATLKAAFKPQDIIHNDQCWSLDYKGLQIDIITSSPELFDCTLHYFSYNDVSNLVGRSAHRMGLKYGHKGLTLPVRAKSTHLLGEVSLSTKPKEIFEFLGYDYPRFQQGFKNLEEVYKYTVSSPYFDITAFAEENMNHINRVRNKKRPTFTQFLEWLNAPEQKSLPTFTFNEDKTEYIEKALEVFAHNKPRETLAQIMDNHAKREQSKDKFNGKLVSELTGLNGKDLGDFICRFSKQWPEKLKMEEWARTASPEEIKGAILGFETDIDL